jgi:archaellum biogenesis ATPase FlaH
MSVSRCTDSYIVSEKCAKILMHYINNLESHSIDISDWWLNNVIRYLDLNIYWLEPTIITQGSQTNKSSH